MCLYLSYSNQNYLGKKFLNCTVSYILPALCDMLLICRFTKYKKTVNRTSNQQPSVESKSI